MKTKYKHIFFDLDGTLTRSRSLVAPEMKEVFEKLEQDTMVISGAQLSQMNKQIGDLTVDYKMGQNGNHTYKGDTEIWKNELNKEERAEIMAHIKWVEDTRDWVVKDPNNLIEDRGSQISYSFLGHDEDVRLKEIFDPGGSLRTKKLEENPHPLLHTDVKVGGTTCFDYFKKNSHKGTNVARLIKEQGWNKDECIYFGDALYPGGNDEAVLGVIDIQKVEDENDTLKILKEHYI